MDCLEFPEKDKHKISIQNMIIYHFNSDVTPPSPILTVIFVYLFSKEHHDGVFAWTGGSILDSEGVIVILDDVKVDVSFSRASHSWGTLDSNANVS